MTVEVQQKTKVNRRAFAAVQLPRGGGGGGDGGSGGGGDVFVVSCHVRHPRDGDTPGGAQPSNAENIDGAEAAIVQAAHATTTTHPPTTTITTTPTTTAKKRSSQPQVYGGAIAAGGVVVAAGDFNGPLRGGAPRRVGEVGEVAVYGASPSEPTQLGRALAVDGALAFVAAHGAGGALRVACTALGQGGETAAEDGAPADEAPPLLAAQAAARDAPALAMPFDTCSLDEFPALG